ncbi:MAG: LamG domain-containing protein, partial [Patescibacteria group bacterium]|nr:LamG domain-containing protein [Patescibacteria group bacterium]
SDMASLNSAINIYLTDSGGTGSLGNSQYLYVSVPDSSSTCGDLGLPSLPTGWSYHCVSSTSSRNTDGTGWIPVKLASTSSGTPLGSLPVDPTNTTSSGYYYTYATDGNGGYELTMVPESQKYTSNAASDGGLDPSMYETGNKLTLSAFAHGMVGYWPMNEGSGLTINDESGNGNNGTTTVGAGSGIAWESSGCINSSCPYFNDGTNYGYSLIPDTAGTSTLNIGSSGLTIGGWFYIVASSARGGIGKEPGDTTACASYGSGYSLVYNNDARGFIFKITTNSGHYYLINWGQAPSLNKWYYVNGVYNSSSGNLSMYVNGVLQTITQLNQCTSGGMVGGTVSSTQPFYLGVLSDAYYTQTFTINGYLNNIRVYNRALSAPQIQAIYNAKQ